MSIGIVQSKQGGGSGISGTLTITLAAPTTAGNCLIVAIGNNSSTANPSAVTLGGASLNLDAFKAGAGGSVGNVSYWSLPNIPGGQTTVAITHAGAWSPGVTVLEVSGLAASAVFDLAAPGGSSAAGGQASYDSGSAVTSAASELWIGCCVTFGASGHTTITPSGAGTWTPLPNISEGSLTDVLAATQIASATGTLQYAGTLAPAATGWTALAAAYQGAVAPPPATGAAPATASGKPSILKELLWL